MKWLFINLMFKSRVVGKSETGRARFKSDVTLPITPLLANWDTFPDRSINNVATVLRPIQWFRVEFLDSTRGESPHHRLRSYLFVEVEFERAGFSQRQPSAGRLISVNSVRIFFSGFLLTDPVMMR